jgi:hypothetical protein
MPRDYSELIRLKMSKVIFSDYLRQREQVNNGSLLRPRIEGGSGTSQQASLVTTYYEGAVLGGCANEQCVINSVAQEYLNLLASSANIIISGDVNGNSGGYENIVPSGDEDDINNLIDNTPAGPPPSAPVVSGGGTAPIFTPLDLTGLALWLDGADTGTMFSNVSGTLGPVAANGNVGLWRDKSGNNVHAWTSNTRPTVEFNSLNNRSVVSFSGASAPDSQQYFNLSNVNRLPAGNSPVTYFFVSRLKGITFTNTRIPGMVLAYGSSNVATSNTVQLFYTTDLKLRNDIRGNNNSVLNNQNISNIPVIVTSIMNTSNSGWLFGTPFSPTNNVPIPGKNIRTDVGSIGSGLNGTVRSYWLNGNIAEILVYSNALSTSNRLLVEAYLGWKWGLQSNLSVDNIYRG